MPRSRSVVSSAKLIALCTLASRITGLVRDILLAQAFGLGWIQDAFSYAFQFPNLFRRLFGEGAMSPVFVPTFTKTLEHEGRDAAWRLLARTLALLTVALATLLVVIGLIIGVIWLYTGSGSETLAARRLLLSLTALMLPFMLTICVIALLASILNCLGSFVPGALAPVILNLAMIAAVAGLGPRLYPGVPERQVYVVAIAVVVAGVLQILVLLPVLRAHGVRLGWRLEPRDPTVRGMLRLLPPVAFGQGVLAFSVFLDANICALLTHIHDTPATAAVAGLSFTYPLTEGALSAVTYAQRLYQFPLGVLVISLGTAALPAFSRLAARADWPAWTGEVRQALRLAVFEGVLAGVLMVLLAEPMVRLLFEYGRFTAANTTRAAYVLLFFGFGMWAFCAQQIVSRAFYSLGDVRTPVIISAVLLPINAVLNLVLVWFDGIREAAFAISTSTTSTLAAVAGLAILQRRLHTRLLDRGTVVALGKTLAAAAVAALVLLVVRPYWDVAVAPFSGRLATRAVETLGLLAIGTAGFALAAWALRSRELGLLLSWRRHDAAGRDG